MELAGSFCTFPVTDQGFRGLSRRQACISNSWVNNHGGECFGRVDAALGKPLKLIQHFNPNRQSFGNSSIIQLESENVSQISCNVSDSPSNFSGKTERKSLRQKPVKDGAKLQNQGVAVASKGVQSPIYDKEALKAAKNYLFHAEGGGKLRAYVGQATNTTYVVDIQVDVPETGGDFLIHWGLFRSDSTDWVLLDPDSAPPETKYVTGKAEAMQTPLLAGSKGLRTLKLELSGEKTPLYVQFVLFRAAFQNEQELWIRNTRGGNFCIPVGIGKGHPEPLGCTWNKEGAINFSLYSRNARHVILCLYKEDAIEPSMEIDLDPTLHQTGDIWHVELEAAGPFTRYGYRCKGDVSWESGNRYHARHVLLDPYAKALASFVPGQERRPSIATVLGSLATDRVPFNWEDDSYLRTPLERLVLYKMNVASFTADESSALEEGIRGTFDGIIHKVAHLVNLGVNAVILEPVFAHWDNYFNPVSFFCPAAEYGPGDSLEACTSLKRMVKQLHQNGIEVILEVIFSHTAERGDESPNMISFRGIDNATYYVLNEYGRVVDSDFGTENTFNCNHPFVQRMIVDCLRYWVEEFHVDGFLFLNGSSLVTGAHGEELSRPPVVEAISFDPILAGTKLMVDNCSLFTGVNKPLFFPHWTTWCEFNNSYRDDIRRFLRGDSGQLSTFATRFCGSADLFNNGRGPCHSMNFVTNSFGFTLADLVTYSSHDGVSSQFSWNCGEEGPSEDSFVLETRVKQVRNFFLALFLSQGTPVLSMGDEYGHSSDGAVSLEEKSNQFLWSYLDTDFGDQMTGFISSLVSFRSHRKDLFERKTFTELITWHGVDAFQPQWDLQDSSFLGAHFHAETHESRGMQIGDLYIAFNAHRDAITATLPEAPAGMTWYRIGDTSLPHPDEFQAEGVPINLTGNNISSSLYEFQPNSSVVLEARQRFMFPRRNSGLRFPPRKQ